MKFQNPSFKFFWNGLTNGRTDKPKAICSPLFQIGCLDDAVVPNQDWYWFGPSV